MIFLPSRERPVELFRFIQAYRDTHATDNVIVAVDETDRRLGDYRSMAKPESIQLLVGPEQTMSWHMNSLFKTFPNESVYGCLADDCVPRTDGWDRIMRDTAKQHGVAWANDLIAEPDHDKRWTHFFVDGDLIRAVGYFVPPGIKHLYTETCWIEIADALGIGKYLEGCVLEHVHFSAKKAPVDATYQRHFPYAENDKRVFEAWKVNDLSAVADRCQRWMADHA